MYDTIAHVYSRCGARGRYVQVHSSISRTLSLSRTCGPIATTSLTTSFTSSKHPYISRHLYSSINATITAHLADIHKHHSMHRVVDMELLLALLLLLLLLLLAIPRFTSGGYSLKAIRWSRSSDSCATRGWSSMPSTVPTGFRSRSLLEHWRSRSRMLARLPCRLLVE